MPKKAFLIKSTYYFSGNESSTSSKRKKKKMSHHAWHEENPSLIICELHGGVTRIYVCVSIPNARPLTQPSQFPFTYQTPAKIFINHLMTIGLQKFIESSSAKRASFEGEMALISMGWISGGGVGFGENFSAVQRTGSGGNSPFFAWEEAIFSDWANAVVPCGLDAFFLLAVVSVGGFLPSARTAWCCFSFSIPKIVS